MLVDWLGAGLRAAAAACCRCLGSLAINHQTLALLVLIAKYSRMTGLAASIFLGNALTLSVVWAFSQFNKHDVNAPWLAYAAFLIPVLFMLAGLISTGEVPPQFDALMPQ